MKKGTQGSSKYLSFSYCSTISAVYFQLIFSSQLFSFLCIITQKQNYEEGNCNNPTLGHKLTIWSEEQSSVNDSPIEIMWNQKWAISQRKRLLSDKTTCIIPAEKIFNFYIMLSKTPSCDKSEKLTTFWESQGWSVT